MVGLSVEDARKLLQVAQLEMVKSKLRHIPKSWISHLEFVQICGEGCSDPEQGLGIARTLDQSGTVIVLGNIVFLWPEQYSAAVLHISWLRGLILGDAGLGFAPLLFSVLGVSRGCSSNVLFSVLGLYSSAVQGFCFSGFWFPSFDHGCREDTLSAIELHIFCKALLGVDLYEPK